MLLIIARRLEWSSLRIVALVNAGVDAAAIALILYASGGVSSGLGILLVLPVGATAVLADHRDAFLFAAIAAISVLAQQIFVNLDGGAPSTDYTTAGVLGAVLFLIALSAWPIANRLRESEALVRRQEVDLANLAQLSQYIIQHLRESILVIDTHDRIRLINESAAHILGDTNAIPEALLGEASPRLLYLLETWRQNEGNTAVFPAPDQTFVAADGARVIRANFAPLGNTNPAPVIVFLEDTSLLAEKVQQSKLAALGRLSASIAHEIRNPVGAMSHAAQLLGESTALVARREAPDGNHAHQCEPRQHDHQQCSAAVQARRNPLREHLARELDGRFPRRILRDHATGPSRLITSDATPDVDVRVDPSQLRQIVWNLCENALKHGATGRGDEVVEIRHGRLSPTGRPFLQVMDRGAGVNAEHAERIFEPFYSGGKGTGLGLFLARELAQTNGATLLYEPRHGGGSIFRLVFADPRRWEA